MFWEACAFESLEELEMFFLRSLHVYYIDRVMVRLQSNSCKSQNLDGIIGSWCDEGRVKYTRPHSLIAF